MFNFKQVINERAKTLNKTIVLAEGEEMRTLQAADMVLRDGVAKIVLLGDEDKMKELSASQNLDISKATVINPKTSDKRAAFAQELYNLRKHKGLTPEQADKLLDDPLYFGVMLVHMGEADGMVAGAVNSTANVLRPCGQILKTKPGTKLISTFFLMVVPDCEYGDNGVFVFADCGMNISPDSEGLSEIAMASAESFKLLMNAEPRVAMLSHSSMGSSKGPMVDKVKEATRIVKEKCPDLAVDGELQLDAAIVPSVGRMKAANSSVAGKANVLVFPDLDSGNIAYKMVERLAKAEAYGPVTQGIRKPVNDLSRGCTAADIAGVVAITCVQCGA